MAVFVEGDIQFTFTGALGVRKFDAVGTNGHGMSHCMKAVDFVVEFSEHYLFVEVKDPLFSDKPEEEIEEFIEEFMSKPIDADFRYKYRDSYLYEWASNRADKAIDYYVLFAVEALDKSLLRTRSEQLEYQLPVRIPSSVEWPRRFVRGCGVFNIASWNEHLPYPVVRLGANSPSPATPLH